MTMTSAKLRGQLKIANEAIEKMSAMLSGTTLTDTEFRELRRGRLIAVEIRDEMQRRLSEQLQKEKS